MFTHKKSKSNEETSREILSEMIPAFEELQEWTPESILDAMKALVEKKECKNALVMWPVRIAAAGQMVTPGGAVEICHILGRDETLRRLKIGLDKLQS